MKKLIFYITTILFISTANISFGIDLAKWKYRSEITFENEPAEYAKVDITPEVYDVAKSDMSDIRIIDSSGQQVPYILTKPRDTTQKQTYTPNIINRSTDENNRSLVTLDFGNQTIKNSIEVETAGSNFRRAVKVEGSNDNITFFTLVEQAFVFVISNRRNSRFNNIDLPVNDYRYLRITVEPMADEKESPVIEGVRVFKCEKTLAKRMPVEIADVNHNENKKENLSIYEYDLEFRNLPISEIKLSIADESFYRHVTIEGRNITKRRIKINSEDNRERFREVEENWKSITSDTIYRYITTNGKNKEKTILSFPTGRQTYRYLKITIRNYDDRPLELEAVSAEIIPHQVIFDAEGNTGISLYLGSEFAHRPQYDITRKLDKPLEVKTTLATLSAIIENPLFGKVEQKPVPWTEKHKVLLLIIMGMVVLVLGGFILNSFKSIKKNQTTG